jgi:hypothetical protein
MPNNFVLDRSSLEFAPTMSKEDLAALGDGEVAYVKAMRSDEAQRLFPQVPPMAPGIKLFALLSADGSPITLTDSRDVAITSAWDHELVPVSVH